MMKRPSRSFPAGMCALFFLMVSLSGWIRMSQALQWDERLVSFALEVPALYLVISGAVFGLMFLAAAVWLWFGWPGFRLMAASSYAIGAVWFWLDRWCLTFNSAGNLNQTFLFLLTVLLGGVIGLVLFLLPGPNQTDLTDPDIQSSHREPTGESHENAGN